jgi:hypothetical protein
VSEWCPHADTPEREDCADCIIDALRAEVERLRALLRPLAALAPHYEDEAGSSIVTVHISPNGPHVRLLPRHAHEAAAALAGEEKP